MNKVHNHVSSQVTVDELFMFQNGGLEKRPSMQHIARIARRPLLESAVRSPAQPARSPSDAFPD
jgi:hypothetical protein